MFQTEFHTVSSASQDSGRRPCQRGQPSRKIHLRLWSLSSQARDPFEDSTRGPLDPVRRINELAAGGAYGVTFHDDDLISFGSDDVNRRNHY
jgi:xylose isomerase